MTGKQRNQEIRNVLLVGYTRSEGDAVGKLTGSVEFSFSTAFLPVLSNTVCSCHREIKSAALVDPLNCSLNLGLFHSKFCLFNMRLYPDTKFIYAYII